MGDYIDGGTAGRGGPEFDSAWDNAKKADERLKGQQKALKRDRLIMKVVPPLIGIAVGVAVFGYMHDKYHEQMRDKVEEVQHANNDIRSQLVHTIQTNMDVTIHPEDHTVTVRVPDSKVGPEVCEGNYAVNDSGHAKIVGDLACTYNVTITASS
ncbi:MAG: hypothetical protein ABI354_01555 [Candidatus Saccharimonadales bacterium]